MAESKDDELFATCCYPVDGSEPKIFMMPESAKPPKGYVFSPADIEAAVASTKKTTKAKTAKKKAK